MWSLFGNQNRLPISTRFSLLGPEHVCQHRQNQSYIRYALQGRTSERQGGFASPKTTRSEYAKH